MAIDNTFQTICGNQNEARCYIIDAERLLRLRGLAKSEVSRRVRLLHHVYTWHRIIGESTFTLHDYTRSAVLSKIEGSMHRPRRNPTDELEAESDAQSQSNNRIQLDDFLRVESHDVDSESDFQSPKEHAVGLRDIHLQDLRQWPDTLYPPIYGIPETWMSLVSQTTRLANVVDAFNISERHISRSVNAWLERKTRRLEDMICSFAFKSPNRRGSANNAMLRAMNLALGIYFYRRIRKVHPWILQGHVNDVIEALRDFDQKLAQASLQGPGTPWPAFIAGCEAMSSTSRDWLLSWMQKGSRRSASNGFTASQEVMREVWRRRDAAYAVEDANSDDSPASRAESQKEADMKCSWVDVLRERKAWLMLY